jgi:hypothetical protein
VWWLKKLVVEKLPSSPRNGFAVIARGAARLRGVSKDRPRVLVADPSRLALKEGEHLRMTAPEYFRDAAQRGLSAIAFAQARRSSDIRVRLSCMSLR